MAGDGGYEILIANFAKYEILAKFNPNSLNFDKFHKKFILGFREDFAKSDVKKFSTKFRE